MSEKPAVLVFTTAYFPFVGGAEVAIQEVARRLKNEYDFFIFTSRMDGKLPAREKRLEGLVIRIGYGFFVRGRGSWIFENFLSENSVGFYNSIWLRRRKS